MCALRNGYVAWKSHPDLKKYSTNCWVPLSVVVCLCACVSGPGSGVMWAVTEKANVFIHFGAGGRGCPWRGHSLVDCPSLPFIYGHGKLLHHLEAQFPPLK